jgi:hypothetical protein
MSSDALPITPTAFAAALPDLPISTLHLKVLELRNSIAHLDYSNEQLRPYAEGTATATTTSTSTSTTSQPSSSGQPDQDCIDAIKENEGVIESMQERIRLLRAEVERRGLSWTEFQGPAEQEKKEEEGEESGETQTEAAPVVNGDGPVHSGSHSAWSDGTFQMGTIRGGVLQMDTPAAGSGSSGQAAPGGSLTDEELRRRLEEQLRGLGGEDGEDEEGGLYL